MKLQSDPQSNLNTITGYGNGFVEINAIAHSNAILLTPSGDPIPWPVDSFDQLDENHFSQMVALKPELVIIGTGNRQRFPKPALLKPLMQARIGYEIMDSQAACRTYNVLMSEGRQVLLALLLDSE